MNQAEKLIADALKTAEGQSAPNVILAQAVAAHLSERYHARDQADALRAALATQPDQPFQTLISIICGAAINIVNESFFQAMTTARIDGTSDEVIEDLAECLEDDLRSALENAVQRSKIAASDPEAHGFEVIPVKTGKGKRP